MKKEWETYEEVAAYLLNHFAEHFGLERVQGKQRVEGSRSGTTWEIDAKGVCSDGESFMIVECRRYTSSKQSQEDLGGLAYRIIDTGARGGIIVSPLGLQTGAAKIAENENVINVQLDADSTTTDFAMRFFGRMMIGASIKESVKVGMHTSAELIRTCESCGLRFTVEDNERICCNCNGHNAT